MAIVGTLLLLSVLGGPLAALGRQLSPPLPLLETLLIDLAPASPWPLRWRLVHPLMALTATTAGPPDGPRPNPSIHTKTEIPPLRPSLGPSAPRIFPEEFFPPPHRCRAPSLVGRCDLDLLGSSKF